MSKSRSDFNESCSSNLVFLRENHFQRDSVTISLQKLTLKFENALFLPAPPQTVLQDTNKSFQDVHLGP